MADIRTKPPSKAYDEGYERIFGKALERAMQPIPGSDVERREKAGEYQHVTYGMAQPKREGTTVCRYCYALWEPGHEC